MLACQGSPCTPCCMTTCTLRPAMCADAVHRYLMLNPPLWLWQQWEVRFANNCGHATRLGCQRRGCVCATAIRAAPAMLNVNRGLKRTATEVTSCKTSNSVQAYARFEAASFRIRPSGPGLLPCSQQPATCGTCAWRGQLALGPWIPGLMHSSTS